MKMTPSALVFGTLAVFFAIVGIVIVLPVVTEMDTPSDIARRRTAPEERGRELYIREGCQYCHSQYVRRVDWGPYAERIAQAGDYVYDLPQLLGTERTGPDLSQAGGHHTDDWHQAHFRNPRYVRPESIMPPFEFVGEAGVNDLVTYVQSLGMRDADERMRRQQQWHERAVRAYEDGPDANVAWLHENVPAGWRTVPNPYQPTEASLARGERVYQQNCLGCHGPVGDGLGPAYPWIYPRPLNFTTLRRNGVSGGILYYQIMNGITGTAMPYFAHELESEKIWDVSNYLMMYFISGVESGTDGQAINASHERRQGDER
jgi:cbb3-type cytochrome oxidase cytochrome c subunit/cytochrome c553